MSALFDLLTSPLGLPINPLYEYIILTVVGLILHRIIYRTVGNISQDFGISNGGIMSLLYWIIKFLSFVPIWAVLYGICWIINLIISLFN